MGIGFAIPINVAREVIDQIRTHGRVKHGFLGVGIRTISEQERKTTGAINGGAYVKSVVKGSPADRSGIKAGDIIIQAGEKEIQTDRDLFGAIMRTRAGSKVDLVLIRNKQKKEVTVTVVERKEEQ